MMMFLAKAGARALKNDLAMLPPRAALGSAMLFHGREKLQAPREQLGQQFEAMGVKPGRPWGMATAITETVAGWASLLGVLTRPAALGVLITQAVAIAKVHGSKGFANMKGGYEYNLALMAIAAALLIKGPGRLSVHEVLEQVFPKRSTAGRLVRLLK